MFYVDITNISNVIIKDLKIPKSPEVDVEKFDLDENNERANNKF